MTAVVAGTHAIIWYLRTIPPVRFLALRLMTSLMGWQPELRQS